LGIKLDWDVEAEQVHAGEDPKERVRRRANRFRFLIFTLFVAGWLAAIGAAVWYRLYTVDNTLRTQLLDTIRAETAALRVGNFADFINLQRSAGPEWTQIQSDRFQRYQQLKTTSNVEITGNVINLELDPVLPKARAVLEERIDGTTYHTVWTYWRYEDGWRHVPTDYTFWGDEATITRGAVTVNYTGVDEALAQALADLLQRWWESGCGTVGCRQTPTLTVEIVADPAGRLRWNESEENALIVPSPLALEERARADVPLPENREDEIAALIADHVFSIASGSMIPIPTVDAAWLRQSMIEWLAFSFTGRGDPYRLSFVQSLRENYGTAALAAVVSQLRPDSDISVIGAALGQPVELLALDWRVFFQWRLDVEKTLLSRGDMGGLQSLWDTANPNAEAFLLQRMNDPNAATPQVQSVAVAPGADGVPTATIQASVNGQSTLVTFRLVGGSWKRSA
jgi:hypothetical protein